MAVLAGVMTASWGAYKDTPYEGFEWKSFFRSVVSTLGFFVLLGWTVEMFGMEASVIVLVLAAMAFERISMKYGRVCSGESSERVYTRYLSLFIILEE